MAYSPRLLSGGVKAVLAVNPYFAAALTLLWACEITAEDSPFDLIGTTDKKL